MQPFVQASLQPPASRTGKGKTTKPSPVNSATLQTELNRAAGAHCTPE